MILTFLFFGLSYILIYAETAVPMEVLQKIKSAYGHLVTNKRPLYEIDAILSNRECFMHFEITASQIDFNGHLNHKVRRPTVMISIIYYQFVLRKLNLQCNHCEFYLYTNCKVRVILFLSLFNFLAII